MKHLILTFLLCATSLTNALAQNESFIQKLLTNKIPFPDHIEPLKEALKDTPKLPIQGAEGLLKSPRCNDTSEIIIRKGDSLYAYNLDFETFEYLTKIIHGISTSFDVRHEPEPVLITTANWDSVYLNNGTGWTYTQHHGIGNADLIHVGSGRKTAYFMGGHLWFYNGVSNPVLIRENIHYTIADLVVDQNENAWVLTGKTWPYSDTLRIIDSTGISLCDIPFNNPINTINGYGAFIRNGIMYFGFGPSNPHFPNSIVPLEVEANYVKFGNPIPFTPNYGTDLGACSKWLQQPRCIVVATQEAAEIAPVLIHPNPFSTTLRITAEHALNFTIEIYNVLGELVTDYHGSETFEFSTEFWENGFYFGVLRQPNGHPVKTIKLVKM